jgi:Clp amino terminal domain, pathogenicity island component
LSLKEGLSLGHNYIGTEHILLGIVRENEGVAARILLDFDADAEKIRIEMIRMLSGRRRHHGEEPEIPAGYWPASPPLAPEFVAELERIQSEKEAALAAQQLEQAANLRDRERRLLRAADRLELAWRNQEPSPASAAEVTLRPRRPRLRPMPTRRAKYDVPSSPLVPLALGWVLFGVALGIGVLLGWLIWA